MKIIKFFWSPFALKTTDESTVGIYPAAPAIGRFFYLFE
jgi:hypothetical protein